MILHISEKYDVIMKSVRNWQGKTIYMVIYGLQVTNLESEKAALSEYNSCVRHAMACESE